MEINKPLSFRSVKPIVEESVRRMRVYFNRQQDSAEFYTTLITPFLLNLGLDTTLKLHTKVKCQNCNSPSPTIEDCQIEVLTLPAQGTSVNECLGLYFNEDVHSIACSCSHCTNEHGEEHTKRKTTQIVASPSLLVIQLLRFHIIKGHVTKIQREIECSTTIDLSDYCEDNNSALCDLRSVIEHDGNTVDRGHYKCVIRDPTGTVIEFDDANVQCMSVTRFQKESKRLGYLLFYEKRAKTEPSTNDITVTCQKNKQETTNETKAQHACVSTCCFTVTSAEKVLVNQIWTSLNEKTLHNVAIRDDRIKDYLSFHQLATLQDNQRPSI